MAGVALVNPKIPFYDSLGAPLVGGTLDVYLAGTTTRSNTWQDKAQTTLNTNPIVLNSRGECTLWADDALTYKFVLKTAAGVTLWTEDNISGLNVAGTLVTFTQSGAGASSRTAQAKMREALSITDFGAVAGGAAATNTAAIAAALVEAGVRVCAVYVPGASSTYEVNDEFTVPAGVTVYGDGWGSRIKQTAANKNIFNLGKFTRIEGLHLIGKGSGATNFAKNSGIFADLVGNFTVTGNYIEQFEGSGVEARQCHDFNITDNMMFANIWSTVNAGVDGASTADILLYSATANSNRIILSGNFCLSNNSQGIYADALGGNGDIVITNNVCVTLDPTTCTEAGAWTEFAHSTNASALTRRHAIVIGYTSSTVAGPRTVIANNVCRNTLWTGIYKEGVAAGPVVITGNVCTKNGYGRSNGISGGIYSYAEGYTQIEGNWIEDFKNNDVSGVGGITMLATAAPTLRSAIKNNTIRGSASTGICLATNSAYCDVSGNTFMGNAYADVAVSPNSGVAGVGGHLIEGNKITRTNASYPAIDIYMQSTTLTMLVTRNVIKGMDNTTNASANTAIRVTGATPRLTQVKDNFVEKFYNGYYNDTAWTGRDFDAVLEDNTIKDCNKGFVVRANADTVTVPLVNNKFLAVTTKTDGDGFFVGGRICSRAGTTLCWHEASVVPAVGSWTQGDYAKNTASAVGSPKGWYCTVTGAPGTWVSEGNL